MKGITTMSQPYRVVVTKTVEVHVKAQDYTIQRISIDQVLPLVEIKEILRDELIKQGWKKEGQGYTKKASHGETMIFDVEKLEVTSLMTKETSISRKKTMEKRGDAWRDVEKAKEMAKKELEDVIERTAITEEEKKKQEKELQRQIQTDLNQGEEERTREINEVVLHVYAEALKQKASSLGEVVQILEEQNGKGVDYALTITIQDSGG